MSRNLSIALAGGALGGMALLPGVWAVLFVSGAAVASVGCLWGALVLDRAKQGG